MPPRAESLQKKLDRVRPPRVQIKYEVHIGDAIEMKELPFVVGVLGDFTGKPDPNNPLPELKKRKFVEIDRDNFNEVMEKMRPHLSYRVENKITNDGLLNVNLKFKNLDDFHPDKVARQVEPLNRLVEMRGRLSDLLSRIDGNDKLEEKLLQIVDETDMRRQLAEARGIEPVGKDDAGAESKEGADE